LKKFLFFCSLVIFILLYFSKVDNKITEEDILFINDKFISLSIDDPYTLNYEKQIEIIKSIHSSVFSIAPGMNPIPKKNNREPKDLYYNKSGQCFDRSRVIEKILRYYGFETRHIALYSTQKTKSFFKSLITPGIGSHAFSEVLTSKGWLVVDSNNEWIALNEDNMPISIDSILKNKEYVKENLKGDFPSYIYDEDFFIIYGLYSRHGMYYPPFNIIPDINYSEFKYNLEMFIQ
jgi:hypothetical protein